MSEPRNLPASVRQRLLNRAKELRADPALIFLWYGLERFLYRLSVSPFRERFILKGALLFRIWGGDAFRPTRDADVLAFLEANEAEVRRVIVEIASQEVPADGLVFEIEGLRVDTIREAQEYRGYRVLLTALLGETRIPLQIDIAFGDAVTPEASEAVFPVLLDFPAPTLRTYPRETVVAEKLEAIVALGMANSRMNDYYDLWVLSRRFEFTGDVLAEAVARTFTRRGTPIPDGCPIGLSDEFARDAAHIAQWTAFVNRNVGAQTKETSLHTVVQHVAGFLLPPMAAAHRGFAFAKAWHPDRGWG